MQLSAFRRLPKLCNFFFFFEGSTKIQLLEERRVLLYHKSDSPANNFLIILANFDKNFNDLSSIHFVTRNVSISIANKRKMA